MLPGAPSALRYGLGYVTRTVGEPDSSDLALVRIGDGGRAAELLFKAIGLPDGSGSGQLTLQELAEITAQLASADLKSESDLRTLDACRELLGWHWDSTDRFMAVLEPVSSGGWGDEAVQRLRDVAGSGRRLVPPDQYDWLPAADGPVHPLETTWRTTWPLLQPVSFLLRQDHERWVRFHSLPGSKRYADDDTERREILRRHTTILGELSQEGQRLVVLSTQVTFSPRPSQRPELYERLLPAAVHWGLLAWPDLEPALAFAHLYRNEIDWRPGELDPMLTALADEEIANVIIAPSDLSWLYAPYDGGADVILPTPAARDELRGRHQDWLPV